MEFNRHFRIINIYGPCQNREVYWNQILDADVMNQENIIISRDLNFSLGLAESLGSQGESNHLTTFFENLLHSHDFMNIDLAKLKPTWRNRRMGAKALARRLDYFLIKAPLMASLNLFCQWVASGGISDHSPIFLELKGNSSKCPSPFKFNSSWLLESTFCNLVLASWIHCS